MIYYLIISLTILFIIFGISSYVGKRLKRLEQQEKTKFFEHHISDEKSLDFMEVPISEMKKELRKFNLSKKDWLRRKKRILMQKLSRRKNRK